MEGGSSGMIATLNRMQVKLCELDQWNDVLLRFPQHTVFHRRQWLEMLMADHGLKPVLLHVESDGALVAAWPSMSMRKGPLRILGSPLPGWSTAYMGPLFTPEADVPACLDVMLQSRWMKRNAFFACKTLDVDFDIDMQPFDFTATMDFETYLVDLAQDEEQLWSNMKGECRTRVRKARKLEVEIVEDTERSFADDYWAMCEETFANSGIQPTHSRQFIFEMWDRLYADGSLLVLSARLGGKRIGTLVLPYDGHTMYYWGGASFLEHRKIPAHNLLHWEAMCRAKALGLRYYDFVSTCGGPGRFKKTFGGDAVHRAMHWERSSSKLMAALKQRYERYLHKRRQVQSE